MKCRQLFLTMAHFMGLWDSLVLGVGRGRLLSSHHVNFVYRMRINKQLTVIFRFIHFMQLWASQAKPAPVKFTSNISLVRFAWNRFHTLWKKNQVKMFTWISHIYISRFCLYVYISCFGRTRNNSKMKKNIHLFYI